MTRYLGKNSPQLAEGNINAIKSGPVTLRLEALIREVFSVDPATQIKPESGPGDLPGWDSLGHLDFLNRIQEEFSIEFELDQIAEMTTFAKICLVLERAA